MAEIASAYVSLIPSFKGGGAKIAAQLGGPVDQAGKSSGKRFGTGMSSGIASMGSKIFAPLAAAAAGVGIVSFFKDAVGGASDLNEASTKIQAIFGTATGAVNNFANQGAKSLGQTRLEVLNSAASFGTFGKAAGLQGKALAGFSTGLSGLSTDMASFFNTDPSQAAEAIAAGLRGESEPLRQFGVLLDDASLRTEALKQGLIKTTKQALTPQQRVLAAQALIYKQTKDAQGDFMRTSGGLANQQRILKAQFTDLKTTIGGALLPIVVKAVSAFNGLFDQIKSGSGPLNAIKGPLGFITAGVLTFVDALRGKEVTTGGILGKIGAVAYGVRDAFKAALPVVRQFITTGLQSMAAAGKGVLTSLAPVLKSLPGLFSQLLPVLATVGKTILSVFKGAFTQIGPLIATVAGIVIGLFKLIAPAVQKLAPVIGKFLISLQGLSGTLITAFKVVWPPIKTLIAGILSKLVPGLKSIVSVVTGDVVPALQGLAKSAISIIGPIAQWLSAKLLPVVTTVFGVMVTVIKKSLKVLGSIGRTLAANKPFIVALGIAFGIFKGIQLGVWVATKLQTGAMLAQQAALKVAAAASKVFAAAQWLVNAAMDANPIGLVVIAIGLLVAGFIIAYKHSEKFRAIVNGALTGVKTVALAVFNWLKGAVSAIGGTFKTVASAIGGLFTSVASAIGSFIQTAGAILWQIVKIVTLPWRIGIALVLAIVFTLWSLIRTPVMAAVNGVVTAFRWLWTKVGAIFTAIRGFIAQRLTNIKNNVTAAFLAVKNAVSGPLSAAWAVVSRIFTAIKDFIAQRLTNIKNNVTSGFNAVKNAVSGPINKIWSIVSAAFTTVVHGITGFLGRAKAAAAVVVTGIVDKIKGVVGDLVGVGGDIIQGLIDGISATANRLRDFIVGFIKDHVPGPILKFLGINSPSKLFADMGKHIPGGLIEGINSQKRKVDDTMRKLVNPTKLQMKTQIVDPAKLRARNTSVALPGAGGAADAKAKAARPLHVTYTGAVHVTDYEAFKRKENNRLRDVITMANLRVGAV